MPNGRLACEGGAFDGGDGPGLLALTQAEAPGDAPGKLFLRQIFTGRIRRLAEQDAPEGREIGALLDRTRPSEAECAMQTLSAPPLLGAEYLDGALLLRWHREFDLALREKYASFPGTFTEFIRGLSPAWRNVGKVTFHLAENKGDRTGRRPFAFMASFVYRAGEDRPKHLPLAAALKTYAGDAGALTAVLAPIQQAAEKSGFIRGQLESRRIFQPSAWTGAEAYAFLKDVPVFEEANIVVRIANLWKAAPPRPKVSVALDVAGGSRLGAGALLSFSVEVALNGERLSEKEIDAILKSGGGLIRIKGQWVEAEPEKIAALLGRWRDAQALARERGLSLAEGLRLLAGADSPFGGDPAGAAAAAGEYCTFEAAGGLKKLLAGLSDPGAVELPPLPDGLGGILRPYQTDGVKYLWQTSSLGLGACLADDMGLGKTLQILTLLDLWKDAGLLDGAPALLVLPATLLSNWRAESARFTPGLKIATLHASAMGGGRWDAFKAAPEKFLAGYDLALVTYGMLPRLPELGRINFPAVIADEAQAIKNPASRQSRAVRALRGRRRIALTGTPVENRLADLWSIFDFVNPGLLGGLKGFLRFTKSLDNDYAPLRRLTRPFILRRLKTDRRIISDLPDKTEMKVYCTLTKRQAALYARCVDELSQALLEDGARDIKRRGIVLAYLARFKQICNHPAQFLGTGDYAAADAGKFIRLGELVESIASRQEKALVFTQFREMTGPLAARLRECFGRDGLILHGGTPVKERHKLVEAFQRDDGPPFFVLSLRAAGVGLNLTAANHVIHFDRWWNPAVENQASDRAFRIGQKRNVLIHKFICKGTLEERIDALMAGKQSLADEILRDGPEKLLTEMDNSELLDLVRLDIDKMEA